VRRRRQSRPWVSIHARSRAGDLWQYHGGGGRKVSIHARSRAGDGVAAHGRCAGVVSIHARSRAGDIEGAKYHQVPSSFNPRPLTSGRPSLTPTTPGAWCFNPRPLTSGRQEAIDALLNIGVFQSTPAHERATHCIANIARNAWFQSTPAHERATIQAARECRPALFQSTPAHERATGGRPLNRRCQKVSIHARSRAGDRRSRAGVSAVGSFNPRPLTSGRPSRGLGDTIAKMFQSTPAHERATQMIPYTAALKEVSIHARSRAGDSGVEWRL